MKRYIPVVALILLTAVLIGGCGGGSDEDAVADAFPRSAVGVKDAYEAAPYLLQSYFYEVAVFGQSSNPDTVATTSDLARHLSIVYAGVVIYDEIHWGVYMSHGFLQDGTYVILLREYDEGSYSGKSRIFLNGIEVVLSLQYPVDNIREYGGGWLIFLCQNGSIRSTSIAKNWVMFNYETGEIHQFGDYGSF